MEQPQPDIRDCLAAFRAARPRLASLQVTAVTFHYHDIVDGAPAHLDPLEVTHPDGDPQLPGDLDEQVCKAFSDLIERQFKAEDAGDVDEAVDRVASGLQCCGHPRHGSPRSDVDVGYHRDTGAFMGFTFAQTDRHDGVAACGQLSRYRKSDSAVRPDDQTGCHSVIPSISSASGRYLAP